MRILHVSRTMGQGGAEKVVFQLCCDTMEHNPCVASCGGQYLKELEKRNIPHLLIPDVEKKNPVLMLKTFWSLLRFVKKERIEVIHTHHRMAAFYAKIILLCCSTVKHVYTAHNIFTGRRRLLRFALSGARVVAVGEGVKKNLIEEYGIPEQQITLIHNAIKVNDQESLVPQPILLEKQNGTYLVGNVGRVSWQKGMDVFLRAMKTVVACECNVKAVIVGGGEEMAAMQLLARELGVEGSILFVGYQEHVLDIIKQLDLIVLSSRWEGFPLTPIEVFSQGKTIVASNIPGTNEIVIDGENGMLFTSENAEELAERILFLIRNRDVKANLEAGAVATYQNAFSYELFIDGYNSVYRM